MRSNYIEVWQLTFKEYQFRKHSKYFQQKHFKCLFDLRKRDFHKSFKITDPLKFHTQFGKKLKR